MEQVYAVLLVDDEDQVRGRIHSMLKDHPRFKVVASASNGVDALEVLEEQAIDLVITDIKMPFIDGIALTREIRRDYPKVKVAYVSGYDDFQYAKEAIDLEVVSYLMKPIIKQDLLEVLKQIVVKLDEAHEALYNEQRLKARYEQSKPLLIENLFNRMLLQDALTEQTLQTFSHYGIDLTHGEFTLALVQLSQKDIKASESMRVFLLNLVPVLFSNYGHAFTVNTAKGLLIILQDKEIKTQNVGLELKEMIAHVNDYNHGRIAVGVSTVFKDFKAFPQCFKEANEALSFSEYLNVESVLFYTDVKEKDKIKMSLSEEERAHIERLFKFGSKEEVQQWAESFKSRLKKEAQYVDHEVLLIHFTAIILQFAQALDVSLKTLFFTSPFEALKQAGDADALIDTVLSMVKKIKKEKASEAKKETNQLTTKIKDYVDQHYNNPDLNMDLVCDTFTISVSYLGVLFKKETGVTFNKYIIAKRMEKAKELLRYSSKKILEIAQEVGYREVYHFSHSFKKTVGQSPKEYREARHV